MSCNLKELSTSKTRKKNPDLTIEKISTKTHEQVLKISNPKAKLNAIIAIHNTVLGPALGGTRIYPYTSFEKALDDVSRLSTGMTFKSAIASVGFGGGKSVIIADPKKDKTDSLLIAFAEVVESLEGLYICAEDVGSTLEDMQKIKKVTRYVTGLPGEKGSGDPGPFTAWGTFRGIQSVLKKKFGSESAEGKKIAIQGLGNVGFPLMQYLFWAGAEIAVSDIDEKKLLEAKRKYGCRVVSPKEILTLDCDVFTPCAMGAVINETTLPNFRCKAIAGCANNQLATDSLCDGLKERGILYAPDFVINAGGLINVASELSKDGYSPKEAKTQIHKIYDTLLSIYEIAENNQISTNAAAIALAKYRIQYGIGKNIESPYFHS